MSVDFENEPVPAMTPRRVGRKLDLRMLYALAAVAAAVVVLILCMTIFFNVSSVEVRGVSLYTDDQIINVGGIYELVDETNGCLIENDVDKACDAINRILGNESLRTNMEEKSYEKFKNSFTLEKMWSGYKEIYERISNKGGKK